MDIKKSIPIIRTISNNSISQVSNISLEQKYIPDLDPVELSTDINDILKKILLEKKMQRRIAANKLKCAESNFTHSTHSTHSLEDYSCINEISIDIKCNDCKSRNIVELDGFYVCKDCGLCNDCIIDSGQEWRFYGADDNKGSDPSRCDIPTNELLPKTSIGALIGFGTKENKTSKQLRNMNYWNAIPYRETSLIESFNNITIMSQNSGISQCIIEEAKIMYKKVTDIKSSRRTKKEAMKAGSIMLACKLKGVPRNCNEIARIFKLKNNKTFRKSIKTFEEIWNNIQMVENCITKDFKKKATNLDSKYNNKVDDSDDFSDDSSDDDSSDDDSSDDSDKHNDEKYINNKTPMIIQKLENSIMTMNTKSPSSISSSISTTPHIEPIQVGHQPIKHIKPIKPILSDIKLIPLEKLSKSLQECITKLHRFSSILGFDDKIFNACRIVLTHVENHKYLDKHTPLSRTSAVIYYIIERLNISINKYQILQTCEVSDVTINKCYQKIIKFKSEIDKLDIET